MSLCVTVAMSRPAFNYYHHNCGAVKSSHVGAPAPKRPESQQTSWFKGLEKRIKQN